jgi:hypothetical protein
MIVNVSTLKLPAKIRSQIKTPKVEFEKRPEGFLIKEVEPSIFEMEGAFKNCGLTVAKVIQRKRRDKALEK